MPGSEYSGLASPAADQPPGAPLLPARGIPLSFRPLGMIQSLIAWATGLLAIQTKYQYGTTAGNLYGYTKEVLCRGRRGPPGRKPQHSRSAAGEAISDRPAGRQRARELERSAVEVFGSPIETRQLATQVFLNKSGRRDADSRGNAYDLVRWTR